MADVDRRLKRRGASAAVFVVGGAAIAATGIRGDRLTADIDALTDDPVLLDEAVAIAAERGIPSGWLNARARSWMPPLPAGVLVRPTKPGLRVTYADDSFLFATKLVAQRAKDADDLAALAAHVGMQRATAEELEAHIRSYYSDREALRFIVGSDDVDRELRHLAEAAARFLARTFGD
ncbi:MAG: hypothetical protein JJD92_09255 [Frankiaceae bacterium]|nr:hypothetical protein [Frankiaceae bacterium]